MNLPREIRCKKENIILVGVIPGPTEAKKTMNSYMKLLIDELKEFLSGVLIPCETLPLKQILVCATLICSTCDIPATRNKQKSHSKYFVIVNSLYNVLIYIPHFVENTIMMALILGAIFK